MDGSTRVELEAPPKNGTSPAAELERANILLVDDHPENLLALEAILEDLGENLFLAHSGFDALRLLLKHEFALILLDAQMPELNGFETASLIRSREKTRNVPIIFVTAHGRDQRQLLESYSVGAVDYIVKPFEPQVLRSKVKVFVELHKKNEQLKLQTERLIQAEREAAERRELELAERLEREHMQALNVELEQRVAQRTAELLEANEQLAGFCYSVSHDLRAPLRAISATSKILLEEARTKLEEEEQELLHRQAAAAKRLGELIDDLLGLARIHGRQTTRRKFSLSDLAEEVVAELRESFVDQRLEFRVEPGLTCEGDPALVRLLLQNLLENACKYSKEGGRIELGEIEEQGERAFFVRDDGIGIDMKYASKIFLPFERLVSENAYPGTGIGLATASRIVARHGGRLWVESQVGEGSTFFFTLCSAPVPEQSPELAAAV